MVKLKKLTISLILGALFLLPTSASAANVYGVVSNKWEGSGTIEGAVSLGGNTVFVGNSTDLAVLSMESGGSVVSHEKNKPYFPTKGMVKTSDGNIFIAGTLGKWKIVDSSAGLIEQRQLSDKLSPRFIKLLLDGRILLVYDKGYYTILDGDSYHVTRTGKWPNDWNINDTIELSKDKILMMGEKGKYQVMSLENGNIIDFGDWGSTKHDIMSIDKLDDGTILAVGEGSKIALFDKDGKKIDSAELTDEENKNYKWNKIIALKDKHALVISSTGQMLLVQVDANNKISVRAKTKLTNYTSSGTVVKIKENQVFVSLANGRYMVYQADL
ncbi:hypothetical protein PDQ36_24240 [Bacillus cereus]|uniref:Uncharacterized protein n=1 Tax=Bacillus toyonensis TaxID=155322 RepID=A0AB73S807_9BACI|nr:MULTISPECIES: hypothetical protein [Bacillus cereus group]ANV74496.1 hypothetical protein BCM43_29115 [Bacillus thuringiensis]MBE5090957.1 hypothetical protein [Bacillus thuringiensis]MCU7756655.1 hypothetical protein [Bacillus cereus]MDA2626355.1 hypothetical protein [Bacillus cereus]MDC7752711.1 hypothetical protein [Bacillus cereus]